MRAGEEGIGIAAFLLKVCLRFAPVQFGVGAILGTLGLVTALILLIIGGEWLPHATAVASFSWMFLIAAGLAPLFFYVAAVSVSVFLDLAQSILIIPEKLDQRSADQSVA